jgi:hypothetical protein
MEYLIPGSTVEIPWTGEVIPEIPPIINFISVFLLIVFVAFISRDSSSGTQYAIKFED